jgi:hypothetical protein
MVWKVTAVVIEKHVECILTPYKETADFPNIKVRGINSNHAL